MSILFPYIVQSRSQPSGVNHVSLYCAESFSAVWCQSSFPILYRAGLSSLLSIQFSYIVQSRSQQSGVNPVSLYCTEPVSAVWCQSCFPILYRSGLSSLVSIQFPYIVQSRSQQSVINPLFCISHIIVCLTILLFFICVTTACNVSLRRPRSLRHTLRSRMLLLLIYHTLCCNVCSLGDRGSLLQGSDAATCYDPNTLAVHSFR